MDVPSSEAGLDGDPKEVLAKVAENPALASHVQAVAALHERPQVPIQTSSAVKTFHVPAAISSQCTGGWHLPAARFTKNVEWLVIACMLCLTLVYWLDISAEPLLAALLAFIALAMIPLVLTPNSTSASHGLSEGVHAAATVQREAVSGVWGVASQWLKKAPAGWQSGVAWRDGRAILVEAEPNPDVCRAFVLESVAGVLSVHHYIWGPHHLLPSDTEAAWGLRAFLAPVTGPSGRAIAEDVPSGLLCGHSSAVPRKYSQVRVVTSQKGGARFSQSHLTLEEGIASLSQDASIFVSPASRTQKAFLGFGGSFTEASAVVFEAMAPHHQEEVLQAYFNPSTGAGYSVGRISMNSCDFGLGNWGCGDVKAGDHTLKNFSVEHYRKQILPLFQRAQKIAGKPLWMLASPWSPLTWMKTKNQWNGDAHLKPSCGKVWAQHFVRFVQELTKEGVPIMAVSVQNEPEAAQSWESCIYTAEEERDFVRDHLGPTLHEAGLGAIKVLIWDHNRDGMFERAQIAYADPEASKYIWGCAYHWYGDARFEAWPERSEVPFCDRQRDWRSQYELRSRLCSDNLRRVAELAPEKHILFTEGCQELSGVPLDAIKGEWKFGERYAMNIITDLNNGCEGWIDWNLFLDEKGGPNHVGNNCLAPIIYNAESEELLYTPPFYALSHFSRFIKPGARRVLCSTSRDVLEVTAFANPDDTIAVVVLNQSNSDVHFKLKVAGSGATNVHSLRSSIMTLVIE